MLHLSNRYTSSDGCHDLAARQPATRAPVLQAIEEPARKRRTITQLPNKYEGFNLKTQDGEVLKTISQAVDPTRALKGGSNS
jgi:hypothetical protein